MTIDEAHSAAKATSDSTSPYQSFSSPWVYFIASIAYVALLYAASTSLNTLGPLSTFLLTLMIAVPTIAGSAYWSAVTRTIFLQGALHERSRIVRLLTGYWWRVAFAVTLSMWASLFLIVRVIFNQGSEWSLWTSVVVSIPVLYLVLHFVAKPVLTKHVRPFARGTVFSFPSAAATAIVATLVFCILDNWGVDHPRHHDLVSALDSQPIYTGSSAIVDQFFAIMRSISALSEYGLSALRTGKTVGSVVFVLVYVLTTLVFFGSVASALAPFLVRFNELVNRTVAPTSRDQPTAPKPWKKLIAILTIVSFCVGYALIFFDVRRSAESIGDRLVRPRTIEMIDQLEEQKNSIIGDLSQESYRDRIEPELEAAFDRMRGNVPLFLDWYYSMSAEVVRFVAAVEKVHEQEMSDRISEFLMKGDPFAGVEEEFDDLGRLSDSIRTHFREEIDRLIVERTIYVEDGTPLDIPVGLAASELDSVFAAESIPLETRLWGSAGAGAVGGAVGYAIGSRVITRLVAKGLIKRASAALLEAVPRTVARRVLGRLAGASVGARAGAAAGAVGGVAGRAIGVVVGAVVGAWSVDTALLKLEELLGRDELRESILEAMDELEDETITKMREVLLGR